MMAKKIILGIDVGLSTTKIVGFDVTNEKRCLMEPLFVKAGDPVTSMYGALGKFIDQNSLTLGDIEKVMVTGIGASNIKNNIYSLNWEAVSEFDCIGLGGRYRPCYHRKSWNGYCPCIFRKGQGSPVSRRHGCWRRNSDGSF